MIFLHFSSKYLTTMVLDVFRIKTNENSFSMKVCSAAPVNLTGNLPRLLKLTCIFIVSSNKNYIIQVSFSKKVRIFSKPAWKRIE